PMKKALLIAVAAIALAVWVASWFWNKEAVATSAARPWPGGMGTLDSLDVRFPPQQANEAARKLTALATALPKSDLADELVRREVERAALAVGGSAALPAVAATRELLLREPVVWQRRGGVGDVGDQQSSANRALQMTAARALVASALTKARAHDPAAWEDL